MASMLRRPSGRQNGRPPLLPQTSSSSLSWRSSPRSNGSWSDSPSLFSPSGSRPNRLIPHLVAVIKRILLRLLKSVPLALFVSLVIFGMLLFSPHGARNKQSKVARVLAERCRLAPWSPGCGQGSSLLHWSPWSNPFDKLVYERKAGRLYYPGMVKTRNGNTGQAQALVIPDAQPHPIHLLIDEAKRNWTEKVSRQSRTLKDAISEYERRYGMRPPKGFGDWFRFARENKFELIDEFDTIYHNILPFLAISPEILRERSQTLQDDEKWWMQDKAFTVEIATNAHGQKEIDVRGPMASTPRHTDVLDLLDPFYQDMGDMNITVTGHDVPWVVLAGEAKDLLLRTAKAGMVLSREDAEKDFDNWDYDGWARACPAGSPLREAARWDDRIESYKPPSRKSLIEDHVPTMDLCQHPEQQMIHGFSAWAGPRPGRLFPMFTSSTTSMHSDLLIPPLEQWEDVPVDDVPWEKKRDDRIIWRGSTTGADLGLPHMRRWSQRVRLCRLPQASGPVTLTYAPNDKKGKPGKLSTFTADKKDLAKKWFDIMFQGKPAQCGDACAELEKQFEWSGFLPQAKQNKYKYVIDVDGNGWSGRFHRLMLSTSAVLKATMFPEWYADHVQPWLHYIPVSVDYSDLYEIMAFFKGDLQGRGGHDDLAKQIGLAGKEWAETHWRLVDMQVYMYRLLLEYNRVMNRDKDNLHSLDLP